MADYITNTNELTTIANAIRTKTGSSEAITFPSGFVTAIGDIPVGSGDMIISNFVSVSPLRVVTGGESSVEIPENMIKSKYQGVE